MSISNNIPNTGYTSTVDGSNLNITVTCNDGYVFIEEPTALYYDEDWGMMMQATFSLSTDKKIATVSFAYSDTVELNGTTEKASVSIKLINDIVDTTASYEVSDNSVTITVEGNSEGKAFVDPICYYMDINGYSSNIDLTVSDNTASCTITDADLDNAFTVSGKYITAYTINTNLTNCSASVPQYILVGDILNVDILPNANCEFHNNDLPHLQYIDTDGFLRTVDGTITDNVGNVTCTMVDGMSNILLLANCYVKEPSGKEYGAVNVYVVNEKQLAEFATKRFFKEVSTDSTSGAILYESVDLARYVNRLKRIYCNIPTKANDVIKCANYNTEIECLAPSVTVISFDSPTVTIPLYNGSTLDYTNTNIQLYVPFGGTVTLPSYVVGNSVYIHFSIDVVTGNGVAIVYCNDIDILHVDIVPSNDVLFRTSEMYGVIGSENWQNNNLYGVEPFITTVHYKEITTTSNATYNTVSIDNCTGYCKFDNVHINSFNGNETEYNELISTLRNGVYVNLQK